MGMWSPRSGAEYSQYRRFLARKEGIEKYSLKGRSEEEGFVCTTKID